MSEVASRLELQPQFVDTRWEVIMEEMAEGRFDCIVGGITITPGRRRLLAWSAPFMSIHPPVAAWRWYDRARLRSSL
jgi:ABC-type amino acid transport substrate-binding protein